MVERVRITKGKRMYGAEELALMYRLQILEARESFWAFRQFMDPSLKKGWFTKHSARQLQRHYEELKAGLRPVTVLTAPPQHGKSRMVHDFDAWLAGKEPHMGQVYASYSARLSIRANLHLQRTMDSERYRLVFPYTRLPEAGSATSKQAQELGRPQRNTTLIEFVKPMLKGNSLEHERTGGSFQATTVDGQLTGFGLHHGVIDDPIKGRAEAMSKHIRDKTWDWLTDDFFTRFDEMAGFLMIVTRWHVDDPVGRFKEVFPEARVLRYAAIATKDSKFRKKGEALFPEHKSIDFLLKRKKVMTSGSWESLYQQHPIIVGGGIFPVSKINVLPEMPANSLIKRSVRYWDKAGTQDGGAYTCGVLMHEMKDGRFVVSNVRRGQWSYAEREARIKAQADLDRARFGIVKIWVEQEPGSGGKESAERTIANLKGHSVFADKVTGSKEIRAEPYAAQVQAGNVDFLLDTWTQSFVDEHETFPSGQFKDQVDAAAGAFNKLAIRKSKHDSSYSWVVD